MLFSIGMKIRDAWSRDQEGTLHRDEYEYIIEFTGAGAAMLLYVSHFH